MSTLCPSFCICPFLRFPAWKVDGAISNKRIESTKRRATREKGAKGIIGAGCVAHAFWSCVAHSLWVCKRRPEAWASDITELHYRSRLFTQTLMWKRKESETSLSFKILNQQYFSFLSLAATLNPKSHEESPMCRWESKPQTWTQPPRGCVQSERSGGWRRSLEGRHLRVPCILSSVSPERSLYRLSFPFLPLGWE